ncbi:uncharacterized protein LOC113874194 [Abrus precatorius]|uniref:Uncharacterized protein LOC113874194 n=1 Tax=Abrus precatorius TaxID=3816 RepID=A0A8B8MI16_ABRPR|nr:uncharacterized protein LOC113874194 [Abrus precatorius]
MPSYAKFMQELLSRKTKLEHDKTVPLTEKCSAILKRKLPQKLKDPGSFSIPCKIRHCTVGRALCDLGASINLMPLAIMKKLGIEEVKPTNITLQLADRSYTYPYRVVEDLLVKVDKFIFPIDFFILDMEVDTNIPLILVEDNTCMRLDILDSLITHYPIDENSVLRETIAAGSTKSVIHREEHIMEIEQQLEALPILTLAENSVKKELKKEVKEEQIQKLELKQLPSHLRYAFLDQNHEDPVIVNNELKEKEEEKLLRILREHKSAIG